MVAQEIVERRDTSMSEIIIPLFNDRKFVIKKGKDFYLENVVTNGFPAKSFVILDIYTFIK